LLNAGESAKLTLRIPLTDLSYWDEVTSKWTLEKGVYTISAAASSRDKRLSKEISL
jgi:beta-glucosidase